MNSLRAGRSPEKANMRNLFDPPVMILILLVAVLVLAIWQFYSLASGSP